MRGEGLNILHRILQLQPDQRIPYERQLLKCLGIYANVSLTRNSRDKLLYIVVALHRCGARITLDSGRRTLAPQASCRATGVSGGVIAGTATRHHWHLYSSL